MGADGLAARGRWCGASSASGGKEVVEGDFWSGRGGDGDGARLLGRVPPETLREDGQEESGRSWRLKGKWAWTLTILLWGVRRARAKEARRTLLWSGRRSRGDP